MSKRPIMNIDELDYMDWGDGGKFEAKLGSLSRSLGARKLGFNVTIIPPGKAAFPYHLHHTIEEMFFILEGEGTLRYNDTDYPLREGDVVSCVVGTETGRQIRNTSDKDLKFLAVSTVEPVEITEYPDSDKVAAMVGQPGEGGLRIVVKKGSGVDYFEGESG